jgi:hypothetical protein
VGGQEEMCPNILHECQLCSVGKAAKLCTHQKGSGAHYKACNQWRYMANNNGWQNPPRTNLRRSHVQKDWNDSFEGVLFLLSLHHQNNRLQNSSIFICPSNSVAKKTRVEQIKEGYCRTPPPMTSLSNNFIHIFIAHNLPWC